MPTTPRWRRVGGHSATTAAVGAGTPCTGGTSGNLMQHHGAAVLHERRRSLGYP